MSLGKLLCRWIASGALLSVGLSSAAAQSDPWNARQTAFGMTAVGSTIVSPGTLTKDWNVLAVGLFCVRGQPHLYLYGISHDRVSTGGPVLASINLDYTRIDLTFWERSDAVVTPVPDEFVRAMINATTVTVQVKDYNSPNADRLNMDKAPATIRLALRNCFRP